MEENSESAMKRAYEGIKTAITAVFNKAAETIVKRVLTNSYINDQVKVSLENRIDVESKSILPNVARRLEDYLIDTSREEVRREIDLRLKQQPLDAIVRNAIDDKLLPQLDPMLERGARDAKTLIDTSLDQVRRTIEAQLKKQPLDEIIRDTIDNDLNQRLGPMLDRAMRDAENLIDEQLRRVFRPIVEDIIGIDRLEQLFRIEAERIATDQAMTISANEVKLHQPVQTGRNFQHKQFKEILRIVKDQEGTSGSKVLMVGPAGSGKSLIAEDVAQALDRPFYFNGPIQSEFKLMGYKDATGRYHYTPFRKAFEFGGVYLFDEFDAGSSAALVAFNTALANDYCDFPDDTIKKDKNFVCLAAANTYGRGGTTQYTAREKLDGATLDRFVVVDIKYDEELENMLAQNEQWVRRVQTIRSIAQDSYPWLIISMRASIEGAKLLRKNFPRSFVEEAVLWRGQLTKDQISAILKRIAV